MQRNTYKNVNMQLYGSNTILTGSWSYLKFSLRRCFVLSKTRDCTFESHRRLKFYIFIPFLFFKI